MLVSDLKLDKGGKWTNDTGAAVELNPPGIVVQPGESIEVNPDSGAIALLSAASPAPAPEKAKGTAKEPPKTP